MPKNLARYEQILRIHTVFSILLESRQPADDTTLIHALKGRLGLSRLSSRTLHRDCDFLVNCGYPVEHVAVAGTRRLAWRLNPALMAKRRIPAEPLTILELVAFRLARELLGALEGTVLWTGIESLRTKLERTLSPIFLAKAQDAQRAFHARSPGRPRFAHRPRLIGALSGAILDRYEIKVKVATPDAAGLTKRILRPAVMMIRPPRVKLAAWAATPTKHPGRVGPLDSDPSPSGPLELIDIDRIKKLERLDSRFNPPPIDLEALESLADEAS